MMMDTLALAKQEREKQGPWEVEVSYSGEVDLHRHLDGCEKNPGHQKFVPLDQFNVDHLPHDYHDNDFVELVQAWSGLIVRVSVKYVSEERPETYPGSDMTYPCYKIRGKNMVRAGTGWVWRVKKNSDDFRLCDCKECLNSPTPKLEYAHILINTAAHVVYDELEGEHTTCHLFFDRGGTPKACSGVITLSDMSNLYSDPDKDCCQMTYVTHDIDLADRLGKMVELWNDLQNKIFEKYCGVESEMRIQTSDPRQMLTIIVSHPHGCSKQVSVGHSTNINSIKDDVVQYTYTTATCPGSSGAYVYVIGKGYWKGSANLIHSGNCTENKELNFSGSEFDISV